MSVPSQPATPESATAALYRAALGPVNTAHYLAMFDRFDHAGRASPVWNPAAGLLTLNWMVFRQLWGAVLVYLACAQGAALLVLVLARRFLQWPPSVEWGVLLALLLLSIALPGAYGTALLHADTRRRMTRAVSQARTVREACATLEKQASSKGRLWVLVAINLLLAVAAVAAYLEWRPAAPVPAAVLSEAPAPVPDSSPSTAEAEPVVQPVAATLPSPAEPAPATAPEPAPEPPPVIVSPPVVSAPPRSLEATSPPEPAPISPTPPERATLIDRPSLPAPERAPARAASAPPKAVAAPATVAAPQAHGINVGLFADPANAEKAHVRLVEAGFPAILQKVESASGERTRVRVGPFAGRAQADEAAARIRAMGLDAVVFVP